MAVLFAGTAFERGWRAFTQIWTVVLFGGIVGAAIGLVTGPPIWWFLLRRVPLGRAVLESAAGTLLGAAIGIAAAPEYLIPMSIVGFLAAAVRLRVWPPVAPGASRGAPERL